MTVFDSCCVNSGIAAPETEFRFHGIRKWRFDYAWPEYFVALEVEGGSWRGGRHTTGAGFQADMEKYNTATIMGWRVLRCTPKEFESGAGLDLVIRAVEASDPGTVKRPAVVRDDRPGRGRA